MPCKGQDVSHVTAPHLVRIQCHSSNRLSWLNACQESRPSNQVAWFNQTPISHCQVNQQNQYYATYVPANHVFVATCCHCCFFGFQFLFLCCGGTAVLTASLSLATRTAWLGLEKTNICALQCVFWSTQTRQETSWGCVNSTRFCRHTQSWRYPESSYRKHGRWLSQALLQIFQQDRTKHLASLHLHPHLIAISKSSIKKYDLNVLWRVL